MSSKKKIALCHPWDFSNASGEKALSLRMEIAAEKSNIELLQLDLNGYVLNKDYKNKGLHISAVQGVDLIFHHHFATKKQCDNWTIFALWNPPTIPHDWPNPEEWIATYIHHDDYLSACDNGGLSINHCNMLLEPHGRFFDNKNLLYAALPESACLDPSLKQIRKADKIFYVGMNWERITNAEGRHATLFSLLDRDGCMEFYGPKVASGVETWKGYQCYKGEIPFDYGYALIKKINEVGIALTLSSAVHQKAGIMTNRIFESAAAGALILADKNDFVNTHFGNSVIQIENGGDAQTTYRQIKEALAWVKKNPEAAYEKAKRSQQIYLEKFTLEKNLSKIVADVEKRKEVIGAQIYARQLDEEIDVIVRWYAPSLERFENTVNSINKQTYEKIRLIVVCDISRQNAIDSILKRCLREGITYVMCPVSLIHENLLLKRKMMTGELLCSGLQHVKNSCVGFIEPLQEWFSDHLTTLKRSLEDNPDKVMAYTPSLKYVWRGGLIDHISRDFQHELNVTELMSTMRLDNKIGRSLFRGNYLQEKMKNGLAALLHFLDHTEFYPLAALPIASGKAVFVPRTTYVLHYYQFNVPRCVENYWEQSIYDVNKQYDVILSYLRGRIDNSLFHLIKDIKKVKEFQPTFINTTSEVFPQTIEQLLSYSGEKFLFYTYHLLLGRAPDPVGIQHYMGRLRIGITRQEIIANIALSHEGIQKGTIIPGLEELKQRYLSSKKSWFLKRVTRKEWEKNSI